MIKNVIVKMYIKGEIFAKGSSVIFFIKKSRKLLLARKWTNFRNLAILTGKAVQDKNKYKNFLK